MAGDALTAEQVLARLDAAGGEIQDTRTMAPVQPLTQAACAAGVEQSTSEAQDREALQAEEAAHKAAATWLLAGAVEGGGITTPELRDLSDAFGLTPEPRLLEFTSVDV